MQSSASAPSLNIGNGPSEENKAKDKNYNIKQYKGLLGSIGDIKSSIEDERIKAKEKQAALEARMKESEAEAAVVQKELSVQLRCAGRSYQQLLGATRELSEQLRAEEDRRVTEIEALEKQVKDLKSQLGQAAKPWREEVSKRDLKILKLQEAAVDQEARLRKAEAAIAPIQEKAAAEIKARDEKFEVVAAEIGVIKEEYEEQLAAKDVVFEETIAELKKEKVPLLVEIQELKEVNGKIAGPYIKQIKELELKVAGLESQLDKVDYSPYQKEIEKKQAGYDKLVKDFQIKQQLNYENIERMRAGFEVVLERMDKKIQENETILRQRIKPWQELVEKREDEILRLKARIEELKANEQVSREKFEEELAETKKLLEVALKAEEIARQETDKYKKEVASMVQKTDNREEIRKNQLLQLKLDEVTKQCEATVRGKDRSIKEKTDIITNLQKRILQEVQNAEDDHKMWDERVQKKEEGYGIVVANLAFAEGQILEERERTAKALEVIKKREARIDELEHIHLEELRYRQAGHDALEERIRELEAEMFGIYRACEVEQETARAELEQKYDQMRAKFENQVADLRVELVRKDRQRAVVEKELEALRAEFEKARMDWDDKEREVESMIRARDRAVTALKNEIEFINDSWEMKYHRLMGLFEKVQKKLEATFGPGGPQEAYRRARDLKTENIELTKEILELKEMLKKQKRQIRDLQLDYDILVKETADIIAEKERGIAEMVGDMAKLEARLRKEIELKERLVKEMTVEKHAVVMSFEGRIRELEQQIEAMKFTDRQELLDTIDIWKRAYERACIERDETEDHYKELLDLKDKQVQKMALEYAEVKDEVAAETLKGQLAVEEVEERWKRLQAKWIIERQELEKEIQLRIVERDQLQRDLDKERGISRKKDVANPELDELKAKLKEKDEQMAAIESGIGKIIEENAKLREEMVVVEQQAEQAQANWEPQLRWRDERYEAMVKEHDQIKEILRLEMLRAQETCKTIEEQVRRFPNPFELELKEAEDKYAQSQAGMLQLSMQNSQLKEEILDVREKCEKEVKQVEEQLVMASSILKEVASLGALKAMSKAEIDELEAALGIDLDGDGVVG